MKKVLLATALSLGFISACGPDNVGDCEVAQTALNAAYDDCGIDAIDLNCEAYSENTLDCSSVWEYYEGATCEDNDGVMTIEYGSETTPSCV